LTRWDGKRKPGGWWQSSATSRSVAEAMDRVLAVTGGPLGSQVRRLGGDERDELVTEDTEASLLT
jgi:hypothetical protein